MPKVWISADQEIRTQVISESGNQSAGHLTVEKTNSRGAFMLCAYPDNLVT